MASDLDFVVLHSVTVERTADGDLAIRRATLPRIVRAAIGGLIVAVVAVAVLPIWPAAIAAAVGGVLSFALLGRPSAVFDRRHRVLVVGNRRIPFADLGPVHCIERRDVESRESTTADLLLGPRMVTRYEVYTRVHGKPVALATFRSKAAADDLASQANRAVSP